MREKSWTTLLAPLGICCFLGIYVVQLFRREQVQPPLGC